MQVDSFENRKKLTTDQSKLLRHVFDSLIKAKKYSPNKCAFFYKKMNHSFKRDKLFKLTRYV